MPQLSFTLCLMRSCHLSIKSLHIRFRFCSKYSHIYLKKVKKCLRKWNVFNRCSMFLFSHSDQLMVKITSWHYDHVNIILVCDKRASGYLIKGKVMWPVVDLCDLQSKIVITECLCVCKYMCHNSNHTPLTPSHSNAIVLVLYFFFFSFQ